MNGYHAYTYGGPVMRQIYGLNARPMSHLGLGHIMRRTHGLSGNFDSWASGFFESNLGGTILDIGQSAATAAIEAEIGPINSQTSVGSNVGPAQLNAPPVNVTVQAPDDSKMQTMMLAGAGVLGAVLIFMVARRRRGRRRR